MDDQESDPSRVLTICSSFLSALSAKDFHRMRSLVNSCGHGILRRNGNETYHLTLPQVVELARTHVEGKWAGRDFEETFDDPIVHIDEDMAVVWAKMRVIVDGNIVGSGTNCYTLHKTDGEWKIYGLSDRVVMI
jgi:hypothetical protein